MWVRFNSKDIKSIGNNQSKAFKDTRQKNKPQDIKQRTKRQKNDICTLSYPADLAGHVTEFLGTSKEDFEHQQQTNHSKGIFGK